MNAHTPHPDRASYEDAPKGTCPECGTRTVRFHPSEEPFEVDTAIEHTAERCARVRDTWASAYSPVPGDPFRVLPKRTVSADHASYRRVFPNGVPLRDADLNDEQRAFLVARRRMS